ncbi:hypothetical protein CYLTODRAFT_489737 [Cylindrobasidium torrendii FP15055 ss-10]|uniref:Uncharacterized protein n=1 Tax=Cylindrobasidium torrendii FP15055 ss-10 TaxID=1314674 RepID=A0A0D7BD77_9AGAR|nr:hypothetical protein CYLTODRAFT_489737 [Cylindrobasidium torrendii FP15055 ss-10]
MVNNPTDCSHERETMINSNMLMTLSYGVYSFVFWRAITSGMRGGRSKRSRQPDAYAAHRSRIQRSPVLFIIAILMYTLVTVLCAIYWKTLYDVFGPNGGDGTYLCTKHVAPALPVICEAALALNIVLADSVLIWRTYIVFGKIKRIVIFPAVLVLCNTALPFVGFVPVKGYKDSPEIYELVFGIRKFCVFVWVYLGFSMGITLYCSIAITLRILWICRLGGASWKSYSNVLEVIAKSSALYTTVIVITSILGFSSARWGARYAVAVLLSVTGIAPTWILARIVSGKARADESWTIGSSPLGADPDAIEFRPDTHSISNNRLPVYALVGPSP